MPLESKSLILHLHDRLSALGGADRHLLGILEHLQGNIATGLLVGRDDHSLSAIEKERIGPRQMVKGLARGGLSRRGAKAARRRLRNALAAWKPTVVHLHNIMDPSLIELAADMGPTLVTIQDHRFFCPGLGMLKPDGSLCPDSLGKECLDCFQDLEYGERLLALTKARLRAAAKTQAVLVLSRYMAAELKRAWELEGLSAPPTKVLPPFVHGFRPLPRNGPGNYHLLAGRLVERKGVRVALAAAEIVKLPLVVAGDGPLRKEVKQTAYESGGRVRYVGWADRQDMAKLLAGARSLWLPSLWAEPFGISGLEALAAGVPVVASRVGGVEDWLDEGETGIFATPRNGKALAMAAGRLENEPDLVRKMGRVGSARVARDFQAGPLMDKLRDIYKQVSENLEYAQ